MTNKDAFLESYSGQTTGQLIELEARYRTDSIVLAFEQAIQQAAGKRALSKEETAVLAVEAITALGISGALTPEAMEAAILAENEAVKSNDEPIADRLFDWIKRNRAQIRIGG